MVLRDFYLLFFPFSFLFSFLWEGDCGVARAHCSWCDLMMSLSVCPLSDGTEVAVPWVWGKREKKIELVQFANECECQHGGRRRYDLVCFDGSKRGRATLSGEVLAKVGFGGEELSRSYVVRRGGSGDFYGFGLMGSMVSGLLVWWDRCDITRNFLGLDTYVLNRVRWECAPPPSFLPSIYPSIYALLLLFSSPALF